DRIDQSLNTIYDSMMSEFNKIDLSLWRINGNIHDIQSTLIAMELQLNRMERNTYEFLDVQGRRPLLESINGAIGYQERTGLAMPYQPQYIDYENTFYTWAATHAFDALSAGPTSRDYSDRQVLAELSNYPLDANVNYLNGWLSVHGLQPFADGRLPGMRDWSLSSSAYSQMVAEWPGHARKISPARVDTLNAIGDSLNDSLRAISTLDTEEGPRGNVPLFRGVLDYYKAKAAQLDTAVTSHETSFVAQIQQSLQRAESFNLWGGDTQSLSYVNPAFTTSINACGRADDTSVSSPNIRAKVAPQIVFSDYLKQRTLSICYGASWQETEFREIPKSDHSTVWAKLETRVHVSLNGTSLHSFVYRDPDPQYIGSTQDPWRANALSTARGSWGSIRPKIETEASDVLNAAEIESTVNAVRTWLFDKQRELYGSTVASMNSGSLKGAVEELGGAKLLLDSFVALGLPLAAEHDDYLRSFAGGEQRLVDQYIVLQTYAQAAQQPNELPLLTVNPRTGLKATADKRFGALDGLIMSYLAKISAGEHSEHFGRIDNVQLELTITDWLARTNDKYRLAIPLIKK
ncbi:MAG TPA: hypothetical protein VD886_11595, partial [Herpetosiphonaceae bacterium]|nr:hypothetical protein [Herpetosiphonaceae bacterium]